MDKFRLGELCAATSLFTDLGTGQPVEHGLRTCLVAMRIADALDLDVDARSEVFYVALLRFLGCTADSHQAAEMFGDDDVGFLSTMAPVTMGSSRDEISGLISAANSLVGFPASLRTLAGVVSDRDGKERLLDAHCEVASRLADDMGLPSNVSEALESAYARWDGRGVPSGAAGEAIPLSIRISVVARDLELCTREFGSSRTAETLRERAGHAFDPTVVDTALDLGIDGLRRHDDDLWDLVLSMEPSPRIEISGGAEIRRALQALGDFADLKVPEFAGHSRRVERIVSRAVEVAGLSPVEAETLELAGTVHDLGVVAAPVRAWRSNPRGPADAEQARLHPMWSERLLRRVAGLDAVAQLAGKHHERLDGTGYPAGLDGDLGRSAGLLASAEFYEEKLRETGDAAAVANEMRRLEGSGGLSAKDVAATLDAVGVEKPLIEMERPGGLTEREIDVLRLLARGKTNRRIADELGISAKTVGSHVEHIYAKAGVRSRAAATLFAVRHELIDEP